MLPVPENTFGSDTMKIKGSWDFGVFNEYWFVLIFILITILIYTNSYELIKEIQNLDNQKFPKYIWLIWVIKYLLNHNIPQIKYISTLPLKLGYGIPNS